MTKRIVLINDLSGLGNCSLMAAIPVISALGIQACPLPTAILSAQTGFSDYYYDDYTLKMNHFTNHWTKLGESFDGICSGFLPSTAQIQQVKQFLQQFHGSNTVYLADPIMGDHGHAFPFTTPDLLAEYQSLTQEADIITPNLTELCLLAGKNYFQLMNISDRQQRISEIANIARLVISRAHRPQTVVVTGVLFSDHSQTWIGNLAIDKDNVFDLFTPYTGVSYSGTGDLFAASIIGGVIQGKSIPQAIKKAADFLQPAIEEATKNGTPRDYGIPFVQYLSKLMDLDS